MRQLIFPPYDFKIKSKENKLFIFDIVRKKYVQLSPEEWVRQHVIHFLVYEKNYPVSHLAVEKKLTVYGLTKRTDILVFDAAGKNFLVVECKSPDVDIDQGVFDQIARYNLKLNAVLLMVTNGLQHYYCKMDHEAGAYDFLKELPNYQYSSEKD